LVIINYYILFDPFQPPTAECEEWPPEWHSVAEQSADRSADAEALDAGQAEAVQQGEAAECGERSLGGQQIADPVEADLLLLGFQFRPLGAL